MNIHFYNIIDKDTYNSYYLSIRDNNTNTFKEIYLTESEFNRPST